MMQCRSDSNAIFSLPLGSQHFLSFNNQNAEMVGADCSAVRHGKPIFPTAGTILNMGFSICCYCCMNSSILLSWSSVLQREDAPLNRIKQNVTGLEVWVRTPRAQELDHTVRCVILGVTVEEACLVNVGACRVLWQAAHVDDAQTAAVIRLVGEAVNDILVVVDGFGG